MKNRSMTTYVGIAITSSILATLVPSMRAEMVMLTANWEQQVPVFEPEPATLTGNLRKIVLGEGQVASVRHFYCDARHDDGQGNQWTGIMTTSAVAVRIEFPEATVEYDTEAIHGSNGSAFNPNGGPGMGLPVLVGPATISLVPRMLVTDAPTGWSYCTVEVEGAAQVQTVEPATTGGKTVKVGLQSSKAVNGPWQPAQLGSQEIKDEERFFRLDIREEE